MMMMRMEIKVIVGVVEIVGIGVGVAGGVAVAIVFQITRAIVRRVTKYIHVGIIIEIRNECCRKKKHISNRNMHTKTSDLYLQRQC